MVDALNNNTAENSGGNLSSSLAVVGTIIEVHPQMVTPSAIEIVSVD